MQKTELVPMAGEKIPVEYVLVRPDGTRQVLKRRKVPRGEPYYGRVTEIGGVRYRTLGVKGFLLPPMSVVELGVMDGD